MIYFTSEYLFSIEFSKLLKFMCNRKVTQQQYTIPKNIYS